MERSPSLATSSIALLVSLTLAACGTGATASPSPTGPLASVPATAVPSPSAIAFNLTVEPTAFVGNIFSGSQVVLLATVDGTDADGPVRLYADAPGGTTTVEPVTVMPGHVAEITIGPRPCPSSCENVKTNITISAVRGDIRRTEERVITVVPETSQLEPEARDHLTPFIAWLAANRPDLGITAATSWRGVPGSWVLIVEHYLFFSADWELDLSWHVMVPPNDWSRIELRHRGTEMTPSLAFQIDSVTGKTAPHAVTPQEKVWR